MAIIIPSSNIYSLENNKVIDNEIDGVTFSQSSYEDAKTMYWRRYKNQGIGSLVEQKPKNRSIKGEWSYTSQTVRKRYYISAQIFSRRVDMTGVSSDFSLSSLNSVRLRIIQSIADMPSYDDNYESNLYQISYTMPYRTSGYMLKVPNYPTGDKELYFYGDELFNTLFSYGFVMDNSPPKLLYNYVSSIEISIQTEIKNGEEWENVSDELVYFKEGYKNNPNTSLEVENSIYGIEIFSENSASERINVIVGNENSAYSLSSNDLFTDKVKIGGKNLGNYVAEKIIEDYQNGKETAEVLCSISNYYDDTGNQVKFDNGENMVFNLYDIVVPMKYNSSGADEPISTENESGVKTFAVLGVEIFYDGAVWQKLTLQEYGKLDEILLPLSAPIITINGSVLNIIDTSGVGYLYCIYVNGNRETITFDTQIDLSQTPPINELKPGSYTINVTVMAPHHTMSPLSNSVIYVVLEPVSIGESYVEISTYGKAVSNLIYLFGLRGTAESSVNASGVTNQFMLSKLWGIAENNTNGISNLSLFQVLPMNSMAESYTYCNANLSPFGVVPIKYTFEIKTYTKCTGDSFAVVPMESTVEEINIDIKGTLRNDKIKPLGSYNFELNTFTSATLNTPKYLHMGGVATSNTHISDANMNAFALTKLYGVSNNNTYGNANCNIFVINSMAGIGYSNVFGSGNMRCFVLKTIYGVSNNGSYGLGEFNLPSAIIASGISESTTNAIVNAFKWNPPVLENNTLKISSVYSLPDSVTDGILEII